MEARGIGIRPIECGMTPLRIPIPPIECGMEPPRIPIPRIEPPCPLICAVAVEAAKTHAATQPTRMNFFQFITLFPSNSLLKSKNQLDSKVAMLEKIKGNDRVTSLMRRQREIAFA